MAPSLATMPALHSAVTLGMIWYSPVDPPVRAEINAVDGNGEAPHFGAILFLEDYIVSATRPHGADETIADADATNYFCGQCPKQIRGKGVLEV